ncbi:MAG: multicopper oxidase domain-containing protein [Sciscionella sp.]
MSARATVAVPPLRITVSVAAVLLFNLAVFAGQFLSGSFGALLTHRRTPRSPNRCCRGLADPTRPARCSPANGRYLDRSPERCGRPPCSRRRIPNATVDYYDIVQRAVTVWILPDMPTAIWGYNGIFPGPTISSRTGRMTVIRHRNELPVPVVVHLHGGHRLRRRPAGRADHPRRHRDGPCRTLRRDRGLRPLPGGPAGDTQE